MPKLKVEEAARRLGVQLRIGSKRRKGKKNRVRSGEGQGNARHTYRLIFFHLLAAAARCHLEGLESFSRSDLVQRLPDLPWTKERLCSDPLLASYIYQLVWLGLFEIVDSSTNNITYRYIEAFPEKLFVDEHFVHELDWLRFFHLSVSLPLSGRLKLRLEYQTITGFSLDPIEEYIQTFTSN